MKIRWTADAEKRLAAAWNAGFSSGALAERFRTSPKAILAKVAQLRRAGGELRSSNNGRTGRRGGD
ncbi:hypothetical protein [Methylocapsa aurea]|uniref:hypothetical protein n=1 Tax=Methylocapsa aurea TaxID=663610 RepID=UPI0012EC2A9D|nr:hypothetical protein [Methylocapsa aurea]